MMVIRPDTVPDNLEEQKYIFLLTTTLTLSDSACHQCDHIRAALIGHTLMH